MKKDAAMPATMTLTEAIRRLESRPDISIYRRKRWLGALNFFARVDGRVPQIIVLSAQESIDVMQGASTVALGVSKATLRNAFSNFRSALRELGILARTRRAVSFWSSKRWELLSTQVSMSHHPHRLIAFMGFCDANGVAPSKVTPATLDRYLADCIARMGGKNLRASMGEIARLWNHYSEDVPGWPSAHLTLTPVEVARALPLMAYPAPLQADVARFLEGVAPPPIGQLFGSHQVGHDGSWIIRPVLSPKTIEARRKGVRSLLWALVETGTPIDQINTLDILLLPDVARRVLEWHFRRLGKGKPTAGLAGFVDTLTAIAAYKGLIGPQRTTLTQLFKQARPKPQTELIDKLAELLSQLEQPGPRKHLLDLPFTLMQEARALREGCACGVGGYGGPALMRAAWLAAVAVAIEIELHLPLRVLDLATLNLEHNLTRLNQGRSQEGWHIIVNARKNGRRVETQLMGKTAALLSEYVDHFRQVEPHPQSTWLFPHRDIPGEPRAEGHFSEAISDQIRQATGLRMNVHAFRAFSALLIMEDSLHALEDIRALLGHASFETAWRHYMRYNRVAAGRRVAEGIETQRRRLRKGR